MAEDRDFYVTLSSNGSTRFFPDNTVGTFSNRLAEPIRLSEPTDWEVGLTEITFPPLINHRPLKYEDLKVTLIRMFMDDGEKEEAQVMREVKTTIQMKPFVDASSFLTQFRKAVNEADQVLKDADQAPAEFAEGVHVRMPYGTNVIMLKVHRHYYVSVSPKLSAALGIPNKMIGCSRSNSKVYGFVRMGRGSRSVWVYSNCCAYRAVADVRVPLLRTVPIHAEEKEEVMETIFTHPYYIPVSQGFLPSVEIKLTDNTGKTLDFFAGESVVTLHFRRRS